jgi:hypothetical protein
MAEAFDADPFLLLRLRGRDRDALLEYLAHGRPPRRDRRPAEPEPLPRTDRALLGRRGRRAVRAASEEPFGLPGRARRPGRRTSRAAALLARGEAVLACMNENCRAAAKRGAEQ